MSIRKRTWETAKGDAKEAWVVDYVDQGGKRRLKTFARKKDADTYEARAKVDIGEGVHTADSASITIAAMRFGVVARHRNRRFTWWGSFSRQR
jgi:integrase